VADAPWTRDFVALDERTRTGLRSFQSIRAAATSDPQAGGAIAFGKTLTIALACVVTMVVAAAGPRMMWSHGAYVVDYNVFGDFDRHALAPPGFELWVCNALALGFAVWIAASFLPRWSLARAVRVAVLLPVGHALLMAAAWWLWPTISARLPRLAETAPLVDALPMAWVIAGGFAACVGFGWLAAPKRRGEWVHGAVMLALATLLLVGIWLPIGSEAFAPASTQKHWFVGSPLIEFPHAFDDAGRWISRILVPPFVVALAFTTVALRRPDLIRRYGQGIRVAVYVAFGIAILFRLNPTYAAALVYVNFVHVLLALCAVSIATLGLLATSLAWRRIRGRRALARDPLRREGVIAADGDDPVAYVEITTMLRGPRTALRPFTVTTRDGAIPLASGAELVSALSPSTTQLATGESLAALRCGDRVAIAGLVEPPANHPFRDSSALVPGTHGVYVARIGDEPGRFASLALALWRPSVAYFAIVMAVALVGLVTALD
jgi:hypothetical protein